MTKPTKVRYDGVAVYANGYLMSRVQNVSVDTDLGEEEARELTNAEVVEYTTNNPQVSVTIETNEYGSCRNLRAIAGVTGGVFGDAITVNSFDGTSTDIGIAVEEDNVLARTVIMNDAFLTSLSYSFDVGGVATESFTFETDNKEWFIHAKKQAFSLMGSNGTFNTTTNSGSFVVGTNLANYTGIKIYIDGIAVTGTPIVTAGATNSAVGFFDTNFTAAGTRYRFVFYKTTADSEIQQKTSLGTSAIGSIPRGKINLYLASGFQYLQSNSATNFLRLQSATIDADLSREVLNELGKYRAFERSLTLPINVSLSFSALASDLEDWAKFSTLNYGITTDTEYNITEFTKNAAFRAEIYDKQDTDSTRVKLKTITVSGIQVVNESFGVDVGGNATQDIGARASNFTISGRGILQHDPLSTAVPTD